MTTIYQRNLKDWSESPLIKSLAKNKAWTVSTSKKMPINFNEYMTSGRIKGASKKNDPFVKLEDIINFEPLGRQTNLTVKLNASENSIILLDIEPHAPVETKKELLENFPYEYGEFSRNGGIHLLTYVPDELITSENAYLFEETKIQHESTDWEVMFNHYITFTRYQFKPHRNGDMKIEENMRKMTDFLSEIVEMDKDKREARLEARLKIKQFNLEDKSEGYDFIKSYVDEDVLKRKLDATDESRFYYENKSGVDMSRYEASIISQINSYLINVRNVVETQSALFSSKNIEVTDSDLVMLAYDLVKDYLEPREKHDTLRIGIPYLLYQTRNLFASNKNRKSQGESENVE